MNEERTGETKDAKGAGGKVWFVVGTLLVLAAAALIYRAATSRDPEYGGKPLGYWLERYVATGGAFVGSEDPAARESREAIRHIGTNAVPALLRRLRANDSTFKLKLMDWAEKLDPRLIRLFSFSAAERNHEGAAGFMCLGEMVTNAIPAVVDISVHAPLQSFSRPAAAEVLMALSVAPKVPYWVPETNRALWFIDAGDCQLSRGSLTNALSDFSEAIRLSPTNDTAYTSRGAVRVDLHDLAGGLEDAKKAISLNASNDTAFRVKGICEFASKDFRAAESDFGQMIALRTNHYEAYNLRGLARANQRHLEGALADFNTAAAIAPFDVECYRNMAMVEIMQKEYELALTNACKAIDRGNEPFCYVLRGRIYTALKDYKAALLDLDKAVQMTPKDSSAYASRGTTRMLMDDFDGAHADLEKALQLNDKNALAYMARGYLKAKRGVDSKEVLPDAERGAALSPQTPEACTLLALLQYRYGQSSAALENCRKSLAQGAISDKASLRSYIWLIRAQRGEEPGATRELEDYLNSLDAPKTNTWESCVARFFSGKVAESNFLAQATTTARRISEVKGQVSEAFYYAGMKRKLAGDKPGAAEMFRNSVEVKNDNNFGYLNACAELAEKTPDLKE